MDQERTGLRHPRQLPRPRRRSLLQPLLAALILLTVAVGLNRDKLVRHDFYDLGYTVGDQHASVENWSVALPMGYRLVYWKSIPTGKQDGLRLFPPEEAAVPADASALP